jgi:drug/metabolite transporter (DMT)-like permease
MTGSKSLRLRADLALILVSLIWGSTFVLVKEALDSVSTILFLTIRFGMAAVALWVLYRGRAAPAHGNRWREWSAGALVGFCLFTGYTFQTLGLKYTTAAKAGFITGFYIALVPFLSAAIYRRIPHLSEIIGAGMATVGISLMASPSIRLDVGLGDLLVLASTVAYAFHIVVLGHFSAEMSYEGLSLNQIASGAVLGCVSFWWMEDPYIVWNWNVAVALIVTSLLATALAFSVQSWAQQFTTPTRTALIFALEPVFAWIASYLITREVLATRAVIGAALILAGILLVELKPLRWGRHPSTGRGVSL